MVVLDDPGWVKASVQRLARGIGSLVGLDVSLVRKFRVMTHEAGRCSHESAKGLFGL